MSHGWILGTGNNAKAVVRRGRDGDRRTQCYAVLIASFPDAKDAVRALAAMDAAQLLLNFHERQAELDPDTRESMFGAAVEAARIALGRKDG